ncbi:TolC family protein [bacterium]|nr:TolC family protein [bacterium]
MIKIGLKAVMVVLLTLSTLHPVGADEVNPVVPGDAMLPESAMVSIDDFLDRIKNNHPLFEKESYTARILEAERDSYLGDQDWQLKGSMDYSYFERTYAQLGPDITQSISGYAGVERHFWETGGSFYASGDLEYVDQSAYTVFPRNYYLNQLTLGYSHPLLKNKHGFLDRFSYLAKEYDISRADVMALENQEAFLMSCAEKYIDWVSLAEQVKVYEERLRLSEQEYESNQKKKAAYLIDAIDVLRAEDAVRIAKQNLELVKIQLSGLQSELAVLTQDATFEEAVPHFDLFQSHVLTEEHYQQGCDYIRTGSRLIQPLFIARQQLEFNQLKYHEELKPSLTAYSQVGLKNADNNMVEVMLLDEPDLSLGLIYSVPFERRTAKARLHQTDLSIKQLSKQIEEITLDLLSAFTNIHTQLSQLLTVLDLNRAQIESARQKTLEEIRMYNYGRSQMTFIIQSRDNEQNAQLAYIQNAVRYQKLLVRYRALLDEIVVSSLPVEQP